MNEKDFMAGLFADIPVPTKNTPCMGVFHDIKNGRDITVSGKTDEEVAKKMANLAQYGVEYSPKDVAFSKPFTDIRVPRMERVILNDPATIIFWKDGTKTIVKCQNGEKFDAEKGIALCYMKKVLGNRHAWWDHMVKAKKMANYKEAVVDKTPQK